MVCKGPPLWNFGISDELYFFLRNEIISWGKKRSTLFQTHNFLMGKVFSTRSYVYLHSYMQLRDRVYPGLNRDKMTSRGVKALTNFFVNRRICQRNLFAKWSQSDRQVSIKSSQLRPKKTSTSSDGCCEFLAVQDSSISDIVCPLVLWSQLTIRA